MATKKRTGLTKESAHTPGSPKKTRQGMSVNTKYSASSRNNSKKSYRGQGR